MNNVKLFIAIAIVAIAALLLPGVKPADSAVIADYCSNNTSHDTCPGCSTAGNCIGDRAYTQRQAPFTCCKRGSFTSPATGQTISGYFVYQYFADKYDCYYSCFENGVLVSDTITKCEMHYKNPTTPPSNQGRFSTQCL